MKSCSPPELARPKSDAPSLVYFCDIASTLRRHLDDIKKLVPESVPEYVPEFIPKFVPEFVPEFDLNTDFYSGTNSGMNSGTNFFVSSKLRLMDL